MASPVPAKSQQLHNFSLPYLQWKKNHTGNHQRGRSRLGESSSPQRSPPQSDTAPPQAPMNYPAPRRSPMHEPAPRRSPMREPAPRQSPMHDSAPRQSPMRDSISAPRQSPMRDFGPRQSPRIESASESETTGYVVPMRNRSVTKKRKRSPSESVKDAVSASSADQMIGHPDKPSDVNTVRCDEGGYKLYIRLRKNKPDELQPGEKLDDPQDKVNNSAIEGENEESAPKTWNLRPRKPAGNRSNTNGGTTKVQSQDNNGQHPQRIQNRPEGESSAGAKEKQQQQKFSIPLSKYEIEEDIFAITGSKPSRRPKKKPRTVQKVLDNLFPGLWLASVTPDSYKVPEYYSKG